VREDQLERFEWDVTEDATTGALTREGLMNGDGKMGSGHDSSVVIRQVT